MPSAAGVSQDVIGAEWPSTSTMHSPHDPMGFNRS
jgi:hypothetical protein